MRAYLLFCLLSHFVSVAHATDNSAPSVKAILVSAKFFGGCGVLSQMSAFQKTTQMDGGNEFILRFLSTEATRLGLSTDEYIAQCKKSGEVYQSFFDSLDN